MTSNCPFLNELWYDSINKPYEEKKTKLLPPLDDLLTSEWSSEFEEKMRNRLVMGAFRYGRISDNVDNNYNWVDNAILRLEEYKETGNTENLIDIANYMMVEFMVGKHPKKHFYFKDDESIHLTKRLVDDTNKRQE